MYSPYGSYSSMSEGAQPMDITQGSFLSRSSTYHASCAFPSWPQRSSLSDTGMGERATSYLSDDDLFPQDFEDDAQSISSASSSASVSPRQHEEEMAEYQREQMAAQRRALQFFMHEQERKKAAQRKQRRGSAGSKKSPKSKSANMAPIAEGTE